MTTAACAKETLAYQPSWFKREGSLTCQGCRQLELDAGGGLQHTRRSLDKQQREEVGAHPRDSQHLSKLLPRTAPQLPWACCSRRRPIMAFGAFHPPRQRLPPKREALGTPQHDPFTPVIKGRSVLVN